MSDVVHIVKYDSGNAAAITAYNTLAGVSAVTVYATGVVSVNTYNPYGIIKTNGTFAAYGIMDAAFAFQGTSGSLDIDGVFNGSGILNDDYTYFDLTHADEASGGSLTLPSAGNVLLGSGTYGVGGSGSTPTLTMPDSADVQADASTYGVGGNSETPQYPTTATSRAVQLAADIATVNGSKQYVLATNHVLGNVGEDAGTLTLPAAGNVLLASGTFGVIGALTTPTLTLPSASNVWHGTATYGNPGSPVTPTKVGSSITNLSAGNIKLATVIDDVTGTLDIAADNPFRFL